ncbi:lipoprotein localization factor LolB, partial [Neisseria sp. P0015.S010]
NRVAKAPYKILPDGRLEQIDWTISRTLKGSGQPKTLQLEKAKFNIRLVFDTVNHSLDKNGQTRCEARK